MVFGNRGGGGGLKFSINNYSGSSTTSPPKEVSEAYTKTLNNINTVAATPWTNYSNNPNDFVAAFNPQQQYAQNQFSANQGTPAPYVIDAQNSYGNATNAFNNGMGFANNANQNISNFDIANSSNPSYGQGNYFTQQAAQSPGGYDAANPYLGQANSAFNYGSQATNQVGADEINRYLSPFQAAVVNPTMQLMSQQNQMAMNGTLGNVIKNGGFGNDRAGVMMANQNQQNQLANAKTISDLNASNYQQALQTAVGQRAQNQADLQRAIMAGQGLGQLGSTAGQLQATDLNRILAAGKQTADIGTAQRQAFETQQQFGQNDLARQLAIANYYGTAGQGLAGIGQQQADLGFKYQQGIADNMKSYYQTATDQQKTKQAGLDALYNQYLQSKAYPFETAQFALDAIGGLGPNYGSTTADSGSSTGLSFDFSDPSLKTGVGNSRGGYRDGGSADKPEVVGRTFDGQDIYRYSLMGGKPQIGLMADEVAQRHPHAVGSLGDIMTVDYARATDKAAEKGHENGANHRSERDFLSNGGDVVDPRSPSSLASVASGPSLYGARFSFVPKNRGASRGRMMASSPKIQPPPPFTEKKPQASGAAQLKELASNAHGLYQAMKGYKADGLFKGLGGVFDTAATTGAAPAAASSASAAVPAPAPSTTPSAPAASPSAKPSAPANSVTPDPKSSADLGDIIDPLKGLFAKDGGSIPGYYIGGGIGKKKHPWEDDEEGSFVPSGGKKEYGSMPVNRPKISQKNGQNDSGGGSSQQQGGGFMDALKGGVDMATKGIGAVKGLGALGSAASGMGSAASGLAGAGSLASAGTGLASMGSAAAGGLGGLSGILSFLPFLGLFSDPSLKTGVGRKGYKDGETVEEEDGHTVSVKNKSALTVPEKPVDVGPVTKASYNRDYDPGGFDQHIGHTLKREGGYTADDAGAGPSNHGINQRSHPGLDIKHLSQDQAREIYKKEYWDGIGADSLPQSVRSLAYDASVNQGPGRARRWAQEAGDDPIKMAQLRMDHYQSLIDRNPGTYGKYAGAWAGRVNSDLAKLGIEPMSLHYNGKDHRGSGIGPEYNGGGDSIPEGGRSFMASTESDPMERFVFPLLGAAAGAAAGAAENNGSGRGIGAIAGGLSGLGGTYSKIASEELDRQKFNWQQQMDTDRLNLQRQEHSDAMKNQERTFGYQDRTQGREDAKEKREADKSERARKAREETKKIFEPEPEGLGNTPSIPPATDPNKPAENATPPAPLVNPAPNAPRNPEKKDDPSSVTPGSNSPEVKVTNPTDANPTDPMEQTRKIAEKDAIEPPKPTVTEKPKTYPTKSRDGSEINWSMVPKSENLPYWYNKLEQANKAWTTLTVAGDDEGARTAAAKAKEALDAIDKINEKGYITYNGSPTGYLELPGKADVEQRRELEKDTAKKTMESKTATNQKRNADTLAEGDSDVKGASEVLASLDVMDNAMDNMPTTGMLSPGVQAGLRSDLAKTVNTIERVFGYKEGELSFNPNAVASAELLKKEQFRLGAALSRSIGGREPGFIVQSAVAANPGLENTPEGYRRVSSSIRSMQQYKKDRANFFSEYIDEKGTVKGAQEAFEQAHPRKEYVDQAIAGAVHKQHRDEYLKATGKEKRWMGEALDEEYGSGTAAALDYMKGR
jgi:hypothetical protein